MFTSEELEFFALTEEGVKQTTDGADDRTELECSALVGLNGNVVARKQVDELALEYMVGFETTSKDFFEVFPSEETVEDAETGANEMANVESLAVINGSRGVGASQQIRVLALAEEGVEQATDGTDDRTEVECSALIGLNGDVVARENVNELALEYLVGFEAASKDFLEILPAKEAVEDAETGTNEVTNVKCLAVIDWSGGISASQELGVLAFAEEGVEQTADGVDDGAKFQCSALVGGDRNIVARKQFDEIALEQRIRLEASGKDFLKVLPSEEAVEDTETGADEVPNVDCTTLVSWNSGRVGTSENLSNLPLENHIVGGKASDEKFGITPVQEGTENTPDGRDNLAEVDRTTFINGSGVSASEEFGIFTLEELVVFEATNEQFGIPSV